MAGFFNSTSTTTFQSKKSTGENNKINNGLSPILCLSRLHHHASMHNTGPETAMPKFNAAMISLMFYMDCSLTVN